MNIQLLENILQLFSAATQNLPSDVEKQVVYRYFYQFLDDNTAKRYVAKYESLCKTETLDISKVAEIIASLLTPKQKVLLYVQIFELLFIDGILTSDAKNKLDQLVEIFKISESDKDDLFEFVTNKNLRDCPLNNLLLIRNTEVKFRKSIKVEHLEGTFGVLYLPSVEIFLIKYIGKSDYNLNGSSIEPYVIYPLAYGSIIRGEKIMPIYYSTIESFFQDLEQQEKIYFCAQDVEYKFFSGHIGLHNINLSESGGNLVALMGASGSGKSTLLNVLNGNLKPSRGRVLLNGYDIHKDPEMIKGIIGYVAQDDLLIEELTVWENLYYSAKLAFSNLNKNELKELVKKQLKELGLYEIKDLQVGNVLNKKISGGQRKRLNIALELIREPNVLFVDEPTSGLSSADSDNVMELLKALSNKGKLVFVVIHQPSSDIFKLFDKLLLLDNGGFPVYYGNPIQAITYFKENMNYVNPNYVECQECGHVNPDLLLNILEQKAIDENGNLTYERKFSPEYWHGLFLKKIPKPNFENILNYPVQKFHFPSRYQQIKIFITRDFLAKIRNLPYILINLLEAPLLAYILAYLLKYKPFNEPQYWFKTNSNIPIYLFVVVLVALFFGLTVSAEEIIKDRKLLKRESFLKLSRSGYLISKILILSIVSVLQSLSFLFVGNTILEIEPGMFMSYFIVMFVLCLYANILGLNLSSAFDNSVTVYILIPLILVPQIILSGIVVNFDKLNPNWSTPGKVPLAAELMVSRWGFEALAVNQFKNNSFKSLFYEYDRQISHAKFMINDWIEHIEIKTNRIFDEVRNNSESDAYKERFVNIAKLIEPEMPYFRGKFDAIYHKLKTQNFNPKNEEEKEDLYDLYSAIRNRYTQILNNVNKKRDEFIRKIKNPEILVELSNRCENEGLNDLVQMKTVEPRIIEKNHRIIQLVEPIYLLPEMEFNPLDWSSHFYSPYKVFLGYYWETINYNLCIILFMTFVLCLTLYFDVLRKILEIPAKIAWIKNWKTKFR